MTRSVNRALEIVYLLLSDNSKKGWQISEIAENLKLPLSTTHRLIGTLIEHKLITQSIDTKRYLIGPRWLEIGLLQLEKMDLRTIARPIMERLSYEVKESVYLSIPDDYFSFPIERIDSPMKVRIVENLGERIPMNIGAPNKVMLAHMAPSKVEEILTKLLQTKEEKREFFEALKQIRSAGYSISVAEKTEGTVSIAAVIKEFDNQVAGAISIGLLSHDLSEKRVAELSNAVIRCADEISARLGG